jgi:hypothetical protein
MGISHVSSDTSKLIYFTSSGLRGKLIFDTKDHEIF